MKTLVLELLILIFCIFLFSFGVQELSIGFKGDENFYFESTRDMLKAGDVLTPRYMEKERFEKPILFYWLILLSFRIFGVSWFAARLPSVIFGTLCVLLIFAISNLFFEDKRIGLFAALFSATAQLFYRYTRLAVPDMTLVFFITLAIYFFVRLYKNRDDHKSAVLFFTAVAFAVLVKGPVGLIIPLFIVSIFCLIERKKLFALRDILTGIAIFALIVVPWFYFIYRVHGDVYVSHIWGREILHRLGSGQAGAYIVRYIKSVSFYASSLITRFAPFSFFIPFALVNSVRVLTHQPSKKNGYSERSAHLFLVLWIVIVFFFFTFVIERHEHYLLALSPAMFILVGENFKRAISGKSFFSKIGFKIPYLVTLAALVIFTVLFIFSGQTLLGGGKIPFSRYVVLIVPVILALGFRYRNNSFMPLSLVFSIAILQVAMVVSPPSGGLSTNKMERAAAIIKSEFKEGDRIGIGSHGIIPEELQVFFEIPVQNLKVRYKSDGTPNLDTAYPLKVFLNSEERIFCVIKRRDYDNFISEEMKEDLYILGSYYVWKRRIRLDKELRELSDNIGIRPFRDFFQNEIYVISNKGDNG